MVFSVPAFFAACDVVAAAVCVVAALPFADRFLSVEEEQLDVHRQGAGLEGARQLDEQRGARSAVVRADERELLEQLRVVVARDDDPLNRDLRGRLGGGMPGMTASRLIMWTDPRGVAASKACS